MTDAVSNDQTDFTRSAGRQLLLFALITVLGFAALMYLLDGLASLVGSDAASAHAVDLERNMITIALREEPPQLDSTRATDASSGMILGHVMEGLLAQDPKGNLIPGVAERWQIEPDRATFWLNPEARWSDGKPVTAHDFVFAWRTTVDPVNASNYAFLMYYVKNAEAINKGELPVTELGARAAGDHVLEVELERPVGFFDKLVSFVTYAPVREDFYRATNGRYGADAWELLYNGPFKITSWVHGASLMLEKNDMYWNKDRVRLDAINVGYITPDGNTSLNFFKDDKIAFTALQAENLGQALQNRWHIQQFQDGTVFYIEFNHRDDRPTRSRHLRRAMQYVNNSAELVYKVAKIPGYLPAKSLFPTWVKGVEDTFRNEYPAPETAVDYEKAREALALAKEELGVDEIPPLSLLSGDNPVANAQAEYYQRLFKEKLGLDILIDKQIFKQRLEKMTQGRFDMVLAGWGPDFDDAMTFGDLFASWNLQNRGRYDNPALDAQVRIAQNSLDQRVRMDAFAEIQRILHEDVVILPNYERGIAWVAHPQLKGAFRRVIGPDIDLTYSYIVPEDEVE